MTGPRVRGPRVTRRGRPDRRTGRLFVSEVPPLVDQVACLFANLRSRTADEDLLASGNWRDPCRRYPARTGWPLRGGLV
jgi:hypothetical protein